LETVEGRCHPEDIGGDVRIILKRILRKQGGKVWTGLIYLSTLPDGGLL
jgi:hypothetical protein